MKEIIEKLELAEPKYIKVHACFKDGKQVTIIKDNVDIRVIKLDKETKEARKFNSVEEVTEYLDK